MENDHKINDLLARYFATESLSPEENEQLSEWIAKNQKEFDALKNLIEQNSEKQENIEFNAGRAWETVVLRADSRWAKYRNQIRNLTMWAGIAASVILFVWLLDVNDFGGNEGKHYVFDNHSGNKEILLEDGSEVTLRKQSTLDFSMGKHGKRIARLSGEAYFKVAKLNGKPFTVITDALDVNVTGTAFSVRITDPSNATVAVEEGVVEVVKGTEKAILKKSQSVELKNGELELRNITDANAFAWKSMHLEFKATPLSEALKTIGECYNVNFSVEGNSSNCKLTTEFTNNSLDEILDEIKLVFKCKIRSEGQNIILYDLNCQ